MTSFYHKGNFLSSPAFFEFLPEYQQEVSSNAFFTNLWKQGLSRYKNIISPSGLLVNFLILIALYWHLSAPHICKADASESSM